MPEFHEVVTQFWIPNVADKVKSSESKFKPCTVTLPPPVAAMFLTFNFVAAGAPTVKLSFSVKREPPTTICMCRFRTVYCHVVKHLAIVLVTQLVVARTVLGPNVMVGLTVDCPKFCAFSVKYVPTEVGLLGVPK